MTKSNGLVGDFLCSEFKEEGLIRHAHTGCLDCRNQLIERNAERLRLFVFRTMVASLDAEDVFQQTIIRALTKFHQFRAESSFLSWLCSIALNEQRQMMRKQRRAPLQSLDADLLDKAFPSRDLHSSLDLCCHTEQQTNIRLAVKSLQPVLRTVVELRVFEGLSVAETAKSLRLSVPATKSRYHRARKHLLQVASASSALAGQKAKQHS